MARIYLASSWRNPQQPDLVVALRMAGHEVYDFRNPDVEGPPGGRGRGFGWNEIDPAWKTWTPEQFREALEHPIADAGFGSDLAAMKWADTFVLAQPCGRSAHLELGWACGQSKRTIVLLAPNQEPELMLKAADHFCLDIDEVIQAIFEEEWQHTILGGSAQSEGAGTVTAQIRVPCERFKLLDLSIVGTRPEGHKTALLQVQYGAHYLFDARQEDGPVGEWRERIKGFAASAPGIDTIRRGDDIAVTIRMPEGGGSVKVAAFGWKPKDRDEAPPRRYHMSEYDHDEDDASDTPNAEMVKAVREVFDHAVQAARVKLQAVTGRDIDEDEATSALLAFLVSNIDPKMEGGAAERKFLHELVDQAFDVAATNTPDMDA